MFKKILYYVFNIVLIVSVIVTISLLPPKSISTALRIVCLVVPQVLFILSIIFSWTRLNVCRKLSYTLFIIFSICIICYVILYRLNILYIFSSVTTLKEYILSTEEKGVFVYILIQLLQVVFLPIPASVICIVGSLIYGPLLGGLYCSIGVLLGSYISFFIGKIFGYKLVSWIVGKENVDKYSEMLKKRGGFFLGLAFLLPMFPDDILCFIAGITNMQYKTFFWVTLITRPIGVICMAIFGSGYIIPFSGWGLYVWAGILLVAVALVYIIFRWQDKMQEYILSKIFRKKSQTKAKLKKAIKKSK